MKVMKLVFCVVVYLIVFRTEAQTIEGFSFEKYKAETPSNIIKADINYQSNPTARMFRTRITEGYKAWEVDFAGYYITIIWGCGTGCINGAMVDIRDGKVYNLPLGESTAYSGCYTDTETDSIERVTYKPNSRLFISTVCSESEIQNSKNVKQEIVFFINVWNEKDKKFQLIKMLEKTIEVERTV